MGPEILYFKDKHAFRSWLESHHNSHAGVDIYLYKKGYESHGLTYEDAVRTALCYGWIDAVTHSCDEKKFRQYFARRKAKSTWSVSNIIRMKELIESGEMTEHGLHFFDLALIERLPELIEADRLAKLSPPDLPDFFRTLLIQADALDLFQKESNSAQHRYINHIRSGKKEETRVRRSEKIIQLLQEHHKSK
jgi:uncharacterized protein YdeI (YjbR/CyaY-like superfamily)